MSRLPAQSGIRICGFAPVRLRREANNIKKARSLLLEKNIEIVSQKVGGNKGYKIDFYVSSGTVQCQILGEQVVEYY